MSLINTVTILGIIIGGSNIPHYTSTREGHNIEIMSDKVVVSNINEITQVSYSKGFLYREVDGKIKDCSEHVCYTVITPIEGISNTIELIPISDNLTNLECMVDDYYFILNEDSAHPVVGDVNNDGVVNVADMYSVNYCLMRDFDSLTGFSKCRADLNRDGVIDIFDLTAYRKLLTIG